MLVAIAFLEREKRKGKREKRKKKERKREEGRKRKKEPRENKKILLDAQKNKIAIPHVQKETVLNQFYFCLVLFFYRNTGKEERVKERKK